mmetsp:Transcript_18621/g.41866  ORF Transcript_18621/g.41866 Transcript_18621/m.41866 type:complete len:187 (+) Transcript_18621:103-663(+)
MAAFVAAAAPSLLRFWSPVLQPGHSVHQSLATGSSLQQRSSGRQASGACVFAAAAVAVLGRLVRTTQQRRRRDRTVTAAVDVQEYLRTKDYGVEEYLREYEVIAFIASACPYCKKAVGALQDAGYNVKTVDCIKGTKIRADVESFTGSSSVPKVFVKGTFIGGCNDGGLGGVMECLDNGKIAELLA